jgi:hypothetical protein
LKLIVQYAGSGFPTPDQLQTVRDVPGISVVSSSLRSLLVETDGQGEAALKELSDWTVSPEQSYELPDTRVQLKVQPPSD